MSEERSCEECRHFSGRICRHDNAGPPFAEDDSYSIKFMRDAGDCGPDGKLWEKRHD